MIKIKKIKQNIISINNSIFAKIESNLSSIYLLSARLWIANVFFKSGKNKLDNMDSTIYLFEYEYVVPLFSPVFAAYSSTFFELACPIFLALGLLSRLATLPLIAITLMIQFFVLQNVDHYYWLFLLFVVFVFGGGKASADKFLKLK